MDKWTCQPFWLGCSPSDCIFLSMSFSRAQPRSYWTIGIESLLFWCRLAASFYSKCQFRGRLTFSGPNWTLIEQKDTFGQSQLHVMAWKEAGYLVLMIVCLCRELESLFLAGDSMPCCRAFRFSTPLGDIRWRWAKSSENRSAFLLSFPDVDKDAFSLLKALLFFLISISKFLKALLMVFFIFPLFCERQKRHVWRPLLTFHVTFQLTTELCISSSLLVYRKKVSWDISCQMSVFDTGSQELRPSVVLREAISKTSKTFSTIKKKNFNFENRSNFF